MPVAGFKITLRRPLAGGARFGDVGEYEEIKGELRFALDPLHPVSRAEQNRTATPEQWCATWGEGGVCERDGRVVTAEGMDCRSRRLRVGTVPCSA